MGVRPGRAAAQRVPQTVRRREHKESGPMSSSSEFRGFDLVRRGYDRGEVDRYLNSLESLGQGAASAQSPPFSVRGRGYDRGQVDARIRELLAQADTGE
jgi:DivIVA domain-containing protein